jgi:hypothetical protein
LSALHRFPAEEAEELGLPHADRDVDGLRALRDEVLPPLWYEHLLVDRPSGRLLAVVDWEAAALGDTARDFAAQFQRRTLGDDDRAASLCTASLCAPARPLPARQPRAARAN